MRNKKPKLKQAPSPVKLPKSVFPPEIFPREHPSWRIRSMEFQDPFGWHIVDAPKLDQIRSKLAYYETMTWGEILGKRDHIIPKSDLCHEAKKRLRDLKQDDIDELLSLHLSGKQRVFGILEGCVLRILWWDPDHKVCPSTKKRT